MPSSFAREDVEHRVHHLVVIQRHRVAPAERPQHGVAIQMGLWVLTDVIIAAIYLIFQQARRPR